MKIAPIDIAHKTFTRKVMGLDPDEVGDFLRDVADQMEEVVRERNLLKEALRQKDLSIMEYKERDETLKTTLQTATRMSEQIRVDSEREGKLIINDAHQKAELILKDSRDSLKRVYQEIADLKRLRMQFETNLRAICQAHVAMLDQGHLAMPDPQINLAQANAVLNGTHQNGFMHPQQQQQQGMGGQGMSGQGPNTGVTNAAPMGAPNANRFAPNQGPGGRIPT